MEPERVTLDPRRGRGGRLCAGVSSLTSATATGGCGAVGPRRRAAPEDAAAARRPRPRRRSRQRARDDDGARAGTVMARRCSGSRSTGPGVTTGRAVTVLGQLDVVDDDELRRGFQVVDEARISRRCRQRHVGLEPRQRAVASRPPARTWPARIAIRARAPAARGADGSAAGRRRDPAAAPPCRTWPARWRRDPCRSACRWPAQVRLDARPRAPAGRRLLRCATLATRWESG